MAENRNQDWKPDILADARGFLRLLLAVFSGWAATIDPFLEVPGSAGRCYYFGMRALLGCIWIAIFAQLAGPNEHPEYLGCYLLFVLLPAWMLHRFAGMRAKRRRGLHSYAMGTTWFERWFPRLPEVITRGLFVFLSCTAAGLAFMPRSGCLGCYLLLGGFASIAFQCTIAERDRIRLDKAEDAWIEQQELARQLEQRLEERGQ